MKIVVIDGQGGGVGRTLIERLRAKLPDVTIHAVGTNGIATAAMLRAGASAAATGENAVVVNAAEADIIAGPVGIVMKNALMGEITKKMAGAVGASHAQKVLIPAARCATYIPGTAKIPLSQLIDEAVEYIAEKAQA